jgi:GxxExxY protein
MNENELSRRIVEAAIEVHRTLGGPGLLESVYEEALVWELRQGGLAVKRQDPPCVARFLKDRNAEGAENAERRV